MFSIISLIFILFYNYINKSIIIFSAGKINVSRIFLDSVLWPQKIAYTERTLSLIHYYLHRIKRRRITILRQCFIEITIIWWHYTIFLGTFSWRVLQINVIFFPYVPCHCSALYSFFFFYLFILYSHGQWKFLFLATRRSKLIKRKKRESEKKLHTHNLLSLSQLIFNKKDNSVTFGMSTYIIIVNERLLLCAYKI